MAFWHGRILPAAFYFRRRGIVVITSENFDGEWIARIIERFGYGTARGSTSRGGEGDAAAGARHGAGKPAGFTLDGPAARRAAQPGCRFISRPRPHWTLRSWDRTQIPKPFTHGGPGRRGADGAYRRTERAVLSTPSARNWSGGWRLSVNERWGCSVTLELQIALQIADSLTGLQIADCRILIDSTFQ